MSPWSLVVDHGHSSARGSQGGGGVLTWADLSSVASAFPVHNPHTAYTAILDPTTGALTTYVRDALCPQGPIGWSDARYCQSV